MILIIGSSRDDVLYFDSVLRNKQESIILNKFPVLTGTIFNQNVLVVKEVYTSIISSMITTYLMGQYDIIMVINVGRCFAYTPSLKAGEIAVSQSVMSLDADQSMIVPNVKVAQIPGYETKLDQSGKLKSTLNMTLDKLSLGRHLECTYMSSDTVYTDKEQLAKYVNEGLMFGISGNVVFDSESAGIAAVCSTYDVPFVAVKVIQNTIGKKNDIDDYINVLKKYSSLGKAIISFVGEIGRSDMIEL